MVIDTEEDREMLLKVIGEAQVSDKFRKAMAICNVLQRLYAKIEKAEIRMGE